VIEDVWMDVKDNENLEKHKRYEEWEPHIQAIKTDRGELALRFCYGIGIQMEVRVLLFVCQCLFMIGL